MAGKHSVATLTKNLLQRGNPFNLEQPKGIITNGAILEKDEEDCLMNCISLGKAADEFYESCLKEKNIQLLETIPKTRKSTKKMNERKECDLAKKTVKFLRHINYACLQNFDLKVLMGYEISATCFYLTKRDLIRKPNKSELTTELKNTIANNIPTHLPLMDHHRNLIVNFVTYTRKVSKKANPKSIKRFFISLWSIIRFLFKSCNHVNIVFDVYKENSIKGSEGRQRTTGDGIENSFQVLSNL